MLSAPIRRQPSAGAQTLVDAVIDASRSAAGNQTKARLLSLAAGDHYHPAFIPHDFDKAIARKVTDAVDEGRYMTVAAIAVAAGAERLLPDLVNGHWRDYLPELINAGRAFAHGDADKLDDLVRAVCLKGEWDALGMRAPANNRRTLHLPEILKVLNAAEDFANDNPTWPAESADTYFMSDDEEPDDAAAIDVDELGAEGNHQRVTAGTLENARRSMIFRNVFDMAQQGIPPRRPVFGPWVERGLVTMVIAPPGVGKTTFGIGVGCAVAAGQRWAGQDVPASEQVLYINVEDSPQEIVRRVLAISAYQDLDDEAMRRITALDRMGPLRLMRKEGGYPFATHELEILKEEVVRRGVALLVIDPLVHAHALDENSNAEMSLLVEELQKVARAGDCAVMVIHHAKKDARPGTMDAARGASALVAGARNVLMLSEAGSVAASGNGTASVEVTLTCVKSNNAASGWPIRFQRASIDLPNGDTVSALVPVDR